MSVSVRTDLPARPDLTQSTGVVLSAIAAALAFIMLVVYLAVIRSQGNGVELRVILIASCIAAAGVCALAAAWSSIPAHRRLVLLAAAAGDLLSLGIIGMASIGLPLLIGGVLATIGSVRLAGSMGRVAPSRLPAVAAGLTGFLLPVAVLFTPFR